MGAGLTLEDEDVNVCWAEVLRLAGVVACVLWRHTGEGDAGTGPGPLLCLLQDHPAPGEQYTGLAAPLGTSCRTTPPLGTTGSVVAPVELNHKTSGEPLTFTLVQTNTRLTISLLII